MAPKQKEKEKDKSKIQERNKPIDQFYSPKSLTQEHSKQRKSMPLEQRELREMDTSRSSEDNGTGQVKYDDNTTAVREFRIIGFGDLQNFKYLLFSIFLLIYLFTIAGNLLIIIIVSAAKSLHSPMYFFLCHLSVSDILFSTNIVPNLLRGMIMERATMPFTSCFAQFHFYGLSATTECFLLTVMSYDRYLAICNPLRYISIMNFRLCLHLVIWSWFLGFVITLTIVVLVRTLRFCGPNVIDHFFCDFSPLLKLSCSDTFYVEITNFVLATPITLLLFKVVVISYIYIFLAILKISSTTGRQKTFSTCSSHLSVVSTYYGTLFIIYGVPSGENSRNINKALSLLYTVGTPFLNPIIYSLRNQAMKKALKHILYQTHNF
ncbi:olfactory receptor 5P64-like [Pelodytes ibericus]